MYSPASRRLALRLGLLVVLVCAGSACEANERQASGPQPLPEEEQQLRTGKYRSEEFEPSLTFRVDENWATDPPEAPDVLRITRVESGGLGFANIREVYEPTEKGAPKVVKAPEDMVGWFRRHPYLETTEPKPVTVGGVEGVRFDLVGGDLPKDYQGVCGTDCVDIARFSDGSMLSHPEGYRARLIVLKDVEGETVVLGFGNPAREFDEHAPEAREVIDTVKWTGS